MASIKPPKELSFEGNLQENWKVWKQNFEFYLIATECKSKSNEVKAGIFLHYVGDAGRQLYNTLTFDNENDKLDYDAILIKFEAYVLPRKNITFSRYKFFTYRQAEGQPFDKYLTELRQLRNDCELGNLENDLLKDMIIIGLNNKRMQEKFLCDEKLTLEQVINNCKTAELTSKQAKSIQRNEENSQINTVKSNYPNRQSFPPKKDRRETEKPKDEENRKITNCKFCSYSHNRGACPAYNKYCNLCKKKGHYANRCKTKKKQIQEVKTSKTQRNTSSTSDTSSSDDEVYENLFVGAVYTEDQVRKHSENKDPDLISFEDQWTIDLCVNDTIINFKIDTGAQANILSYHQYLRLEERPKLTKAKVTLTAYNDSTIPTKGSCILNVVHRNKTIPVQFIVAEIDSQPIIGLKSCQRMHLVQRIHNIRSETRRIPNYIDDYLDCFGRLGSFSKPHHIYIDPNVVPTVSPPKSVPIAKESQLYDEVMRMVEMNVVAKVEEPTDWVSSYVAVEKGDGSMRLCLDPRDLNKAIKRPQFQLPTAEQILAKIADGKVFTKLDASAAYWQIPVDAESSNLLTFSTPFGRFKFLRLPYGLCSASDVCQQYISEVLQGLEGTANSQDDIIIWGADKEELKIRTLKVMTEIRKSGMKLNRSKCQFEINELIFLGHKITVNGIQVDDSKIEAITKMEYPTNIKELQRFLGTVNYLRKFIPKLSDKTTNLNKLLQKDVIWFFEDIHKKEVDELKKLITNAPILKVFDSSHPTRISCDASSIGLGAILEQKDDGENWRPVAYASRTLRDAERNYCQLEKETLSILFACTKFHQYVYGRRFLVFNDHKPLKSIFNKSMTKAPARIQRFLLRLQKYDFELHYLAGALLYIPDTLSRSSLKDTTPEISDDEMRLFVHSVISSDLISDRKMDQLKEETQKDTTLQLLQKMIIDGWPADKKKIPDILLPYFKDKNDLTVFEGIILKDNRIIIPTSLRKTYLKLLHISHLGLVKTKTLARNSVYWPQINQQLEEVVQGCESCQIFRNQQKQETEIKHDIPYRPWSKVGTDLFQLHSNDYLIIVDYTTNYFDLALLPDKKSATVATYSKQIFSKFGIPKIVVSDNGPEFVGKSYNNFSRKWDFKHITSSPYYPQSNGQIERTIQTVKKTIKKAVNKDEDPYLALLALRSSPGPYNNTSPATQMFNRPIRTILPSVNSSHTIVNKKLIKQKEVESNSNNNKDRINNNDRNQNNDDNNNKLKDLSELQIDDQVRLYNGKKWSIKGSVLEKSKHPRSYLILTKNGTKLRRNRKHIQLTRRANMEDSNVNKNSNDSECSFSLIGDNPQDRLIELEDDLLSSSENDNSSESGSNANLIESMINLSIIDDDVSDEALDLPIQPLQLTTRSGRIIHPPRYLGDYHQSSP